MQRARFYVLYLLFGAASYWIPDIVIQWIQPPHKVWISLLTFLVPSLVIGAWYVLSKSQRFSGHRVGLPLFMLIGIWMFGPLAIAIGGIPNGGSFLHAENLINFMTLWAMFPITTFMMSTYSGSLGGFVVATVVLVAISIGAAIRGKTSNHSLQARRP